MKSPLLIVCTTVLAVLAVQALLLYAAASGGWLDVAADHDYPPGLESFLTAARESAIHDRIEDVEAPADLQDPERIRRGILHYEAMCVRCHAAPGREAEAFSQGLDPAPPLLSHEEHEAAEVHWVVENGIKMTGMPAFGASEEPDALWDITAFVQQLPRLDEASYARTLREARAAAPDTGHEHAPGQEHDDAPDQEREDGRED